VSGQARATREGFEVSHEGGFEQVTLLRKRGYFGWVSDENPEQATSSEVSYEVRG